MRILCSLLSCAILASVVGCARRQLHTTPKLTELSAKIAAKPDDAQAYANRGYARALLGQKQAARADLRRAVELNPGAPMLNQVGWAYFNLGDAREALRVWQQAATISKHNARYDHYSLALGYWATGDIVHALEHYDLAVKRDERFGDSKGLAERTAEWTDTERHAIQALYSRWSKAYVGANP
jgi:tetratricopeptide (TPR) repeat protein